VYIGLAYFNCFTLQQGIRLVLMGRIHIAPTQIRLIPITIRHQTRSDAKHLKLQLLVTSSDTSRTISAVIPIRHLSMWNESTYTPIQATYFSSQSTPTAFVAIPPKAPSDAKPRPPLVALCKRVLFIVAVAALLTVVPLKCSWSWSGCLKAAFLGRSTASAETELDHHSHWAYILGASTQSSSPIFSTRFNDDTGIRLARTQRRRCLGSVTFPRVLSK
jgi:hypothetical protein